MIAGQATYPRMSRPEQAYVQIDLVGQFTAAAGCAIYDGGAWPEKWRYSYFTGEPTLNIVHHQFVKPDGVSYTTEKEKGREQTEFMRSGDMWFRPIETRIGPDGALYIVDFYNQAVIHNDTRGPLHGPANAAVRPDRDHYFGRIWRVQHKQATKLAPPALNRADLGGLIRAIETSPNAHSQADGLAACAGELCGGSTARAHQEADGKQRARAVRAGAQRDDRRPSARRCSTPSRKATDNWTRSAIAAGATDQASVYVASAFALRATAGADGVRAGCRAGSIARDRPPVARGRRRRRQVRPVHSRLPLCGLSPGWRAVRSPWTRRRPRPCKSCWTTRRRRRRRCRSSRSGTRPARSRRAPIDRLVCCSLSSRAPTTSEDRRVELAASLLAVPQRRPAALAAIAPMLAEADGTDASRDHAR